MKEEIIMIGAGGHAKVCIELLRAKGEQVSFCIGQEESSEECLGIPVLKGDSHLKLLYEQGFSRLFVAIGSNSLRARLAKAAINEGYQLVNAISPQAVISPSARLGQGLAIMAGVVINAEAEIGDLAIINTGTTVDHDCQIGEAVHLAPQCALAGKVIVGQQSFLGVGSKVIPEIKIGERVKIGAGSVLIKDLGSDLTAVGVPARIIKKSSRVEISCNESI